MLKAVVDPQERVRCQILATHFRAHKISNDLNSYTKHFDSAKNLQKEWVALQACQGAQIQKVVGVNWSTLQLTLEFDQSAIPLIEFEPKDLALFVSLLPSVVHTIKHCHSKGWVHGDIKPSNLLYVPQLQHIRLIDFGASCPMGSSREALSDWQATPMFASPNQKSGEGLVETGDDWFSLIQIIDQIMSYMHDDLINSTLILWKKALSLEI
ncbi:protein kinase domain-containing protein [Aliivibrio salmonicida]|uniref:protein kinase domain-containing protein n=1 Tax=Aliivibrio salmonicida TaxID=40269 RepID=UPI00406C0430